MSRAEYELNPPAAVSNGHYARRQLFGRAWLITWSHRCRLALALRLAARYHGRRLLDYGCGDGTFLGLACNAPCRPAQAVGAEIAADLVADCRHRLEGAPRLSFVTVAELDGPIAPPTFDVIVCMEVLEHVVDWAPVFALWDRLLVPGGELLISVPNETGPALLVKQLARRVAGWCGIGDYPGSEPYTWSEFARSLFARCRPQY